MKKNPEIFPAEFLPHVDLQEEVDRRTINSKTYSIDAANNRHKLCKVIGAIHYKEDKEWKEIDLTIKDEDGFFVVDKTLYDLKIFKDKIGYSYKSKQGGRIDVMLNSIGDIHVNDLSLNIEPKIVKDKENRLVWRDTVDGIDFFMVLRPLKAAMYKSIKNEDAPCKFVWDVYEDITKNAAFVRKTVGYDKDKNRMEIKNSIGDKGVFKSKETGNDYRHLLFTEEFTGRVAKIKDKKTRLKRWSTALEYPTVIDANVIEKLWSNDVCFPATIDATALEYITADVDDGMETTYYGHWLSRGSYFSQGLYYGYIDHGGLRFQTIGVPQGSTINSAAMWVKVEHILGTPQIKVYADDVDDAAQWADDNLPSGVTRTTAYKNWNPTTAGSTIISMTNIIQEIISRGGWGSGNDMRFALLNDKTGAGNHIAAIWDYCNLYGEPPALLVIEYTAPPPTLNINHGNITRIVVAI